MVHDELHELIFFKFSVSKLFLHQFSMMLITRLKEFSKSFTLELDIMALVSSANSIGVAYFFVNLMPVTKFRLVEEI